MVHFSGLLEVSLDRLGVFHMLFKSDLYNSSYGPFFGTARGKFRPAWSGSYVIQDLTQEGASWLTDLDGNQVTKPIHMNQLKKFYA